MADLHTPLPWDIVPNGAGCVRGTEHLFSLVHRYQTKNMLVSETVAENLELADAETIVKAMGVYIEGRPSDRIR